MIPLILFAFSASTFAGDIRSCEERRQEVQSKIEMAKSHNDSYRMKKLERSLSYINQYCTKESVQAEREIEVSKRTLKVKEAEAELQESIAKGKDAYKIEKKRLKVERAKQDLDLAKKHMK